MIDWSASSVPTRPRAKDSIWWCVGQWEDDRLVIGDPTNARTRDEATQRLLAELVSHVGQEHRILVGFDFPYGYPARLAARLGLGGTPWTRIWDELPKLIRDEADNSNNRFEVASAWNERISGTATPFWGHPANQEYPALRRTKPALPDGLRPLRLTETRIRGPKSVWQLYGNGSVGSQVLLGIPRLRAIVNDPRLRSSSRVWPFETGFRVPAYAPGTAAIVHAEIYPSIVRPCSLPGEVRDAAQVRTLVTKFANDDAAGRLGEFFQNPELDSGDRDMILREEGWILGV